MLALCDLEHEIRDYIPACIFWSSASEGHFGVKVFTASYLHSWFRIALPTRGLLTSRHERLSSLLSSKSSCVRASVLACPSPHCPVISESNPLADRRIALAIEGTRCCTWYNSHAYFPTMPTVRTTALRCFTRLAWLVSWPCRAESRMLPVARFIWLTSAVASS
jgi:hypothetical protein